jgi:hypothetical protein
MESPFLKFDANYLSIMSCAWAISAPRLSIAQKAAEK